MALAALLSAGGARAALFEDEDHAIASGEDDGVRVGAEIIGSGEKAEGIGQLTVALRALYQQADVIDERCCFVNIDSGLLVGVGGCCGTHVGRGV